MNLFIAKLLDALLASTEYRHQSALDKAIRGYWWSTTEAGCALVDFLASTEDFAEFDQQIQMLGTHGRSNKLEDLADWLIERAQIVGGEQAERELYDYLNAETLEVFATMLMANTSIESEYQFLNGVILVEPQNLPNRHLIRGIFSNTFAHSLPLPKVNCLLIAPYEQKKLHWPNIENRPGKSADNFPLQLLEETQYCLALARPIDWGIQIIGFGTFAPDHLPFMESVSGWSLRSYKIPAPSPPIIELEMRNADGHLKKLAKLPEQFKTKFLHSVERLNNYNSGASMVERAIELRICLESIFLDDGNKEQLRYTLALRAALFLGADLAERENIRKVMKYAYDATSIAVHQGKMGKRHVDLLPQAAELARQSLIKILNDGPIEWQSLELGA